MLPACCPHQEIIAQGCGQALSAYYQILRTPLSFCLTMRELW